MTAPAKATKPASALDWINHTIRHADPAALAARAHGRPASLRPAPPAVRIPAAGQSVRAGLASRMQGQPIGSAMPTPSAAAASAMAPAVVGATLVAKSAPAATSPPASALDWIDSSIRHADPAALAARTPAPLPGLAAAAAPSSTPAAASVITPRSVGDLQRLLATRQRAQASAPAPAPLQAFRRDLPGEEIAPGLWLDTTHVPMPVPAAPLSLAFARRPDDSVHPRQLLFFDTETTGLAGGTGTRAFMIGAADFHDDPLHGPGLRVRQLLIATLGAETAMLDAFAAWLEPATVLSSFNGRSYDAPLLKTRYRLARRREPLAAREHIDLLHPARRRWKGLWENCRLGTIERQVLGIARDDDLPGSQAPGAWLDFLRGGSSALLHRVAAHNHQDVVTLALLFQRLVDEATRDGDNAGNAAAVAAR